MRNLITICAIVSLFMITGPVRANWETFVIRESNEAGSAQPVIEENETAPDNSTGWTRFGIVESGQKAGWATNSMNGETVGDIQSFSITRYSGTPSSAYGPYINVWITDDDGDYAILANEPSNTEWVTGDVRNAWDVTWSMLENKTAKIYEQGTTFDLPSGELTFSDFADYTIEAPSSAPSASGGGAPDDLNAATYTAYGFNWVFGDTESNYDNDPDGYYVKNPSLVPEPATMSLLAIGGLAVLRRRRRRA